MRRLPADFPYFAMVASAATLFAVFTAFLNWQLAVIELVVILLFVVVAVIRFKNNVALRNRTLNTVAEYLQPGEKDSLHVFPIPVLVCDESGKITWFNDLFKVRVLGDEELVDDRIEQFTSGMKIDEIRGMDSVPVEYGESSYTIFSSRIQSGKTISFALYFVDDTNLKKLAADYRYSKPVVVRINVDNVDEVFRNFKESDKAAISGGVEKLIENWASKFETVMSKTESSKFLIITQEKDLANMIQERFSVLKDVREFSYEGRTGISLSIGVGRGEGLAECDKFSNLALDMALGRGGDQAAVNTNGKYEFYGGVSGGTERRSRTKNRIVATAVGELLEGSDNIIVMGHRFADLDALGAAIGLRKAAEVLGKPAYIAMSRTKTLAKPLLERLDSLGKDVVISEEQAFDLLTKKSLLIIVDTHRADFVEYPELYHRASTVVVIDHHRKNVDFISDAVIFFHNPNASSASEMVTEMLAYLTSDGTRLIDKFEAEALLSGIMLDTRNFILRTGVQTFEAAAYLRDLGADTVSVKQLFANTLDAYRQKNTVVASADIYRECAIAVSDAKNDDVRIVSSQAADELLNIAGVKASFVLFSADSVVNISARSLGDINVQIIMEALGGGGHQTMAAAQLKEKTIDDAKVRLLQAIDKFYLENK